MNDRAAQNKALLLEALRMSEADYHGLVYEQGLRYLAQYLKGYGPAQRALEGQASYWAWFTKQWDRRNAEFIRDHQVREYLPYQDAWYRGRLLRGYLIWQDGHGMAIEGVRVARKVLLEYVNDKDTKATPTA